MELLSGTRIFPDKRLVVCCVLDWFKQLGDRCRFCAVCCAPVVLSLMESSFALSSVTVVIHVMLADNRIASHLSEESIRSTSSTVTNVSCPVAFDRTVSHTCWMHDFSEKRILHSFYDLLRQWKGTGYERFY